MQPLPFGMKQARPATTPNGGLSGATYSPERQINLLGGVPLIDASGGRTDYWTENDGLSDPDKD